MPKVDEGTTRPPVVVAMWMFGVELNWHPRCEKAVGDCPFCGAEGKFSLTVAREVWRCFRCNIGTADVPATNGHANGASNGKVFEGGNLATFLQLVHARSVQQTTDADLAALAAERGLLSPTTLKAWGVCRAFITGDWLIPGHTDAGRVRQLCRWVTPPGGKKPAVQGCPGVPQGLFGMHLWDAKKGQVQLMEGVWDAMALWEVLRRCRFEGETPVEANEAGSLLSDINVVASPGCQSFGEKWAIPFAGKSVVLAFDNDHPREILDPKTKVGTGRHIQPALQGGKRVAGLLAALSEPPEEVMWLKWGDDVGPHGRGWSRELPDGCDVRDWLTGRALVNPKADARIKLPAFKLQQRFQALVEMLAKVEPIPSGWVAGRTEAAKASGRVDLELLPCTSYRDLVNEWRKALDWNEGLNRGLLVSLAVCVSTMQQGSQLWAKVLGPPSCGKTTIAEGISTAKRYVIAKSRISGMHTGFLSEKGGPKTVSLVTMCRDKTLVIKDGDSLLQIPNLGQVLSELRDVYDRVSRTIYRNGVANDEEMLNETFILYGTSSLREIDGSELGERFIDVRVVDEIDTVQEMSTAMRIFHTAFRQTCTTVGKNADEQDTPEKTRAKQFTGGYVTYLRTNGGMLYNRVQEAMYRVPEKLMAVGEQVTFLANFVSHMRARPPRKQDEDVQREMCYRLTEQLTRLATCLAVVMNKVAIDDEVMRHVRCVALDTAQGKTLRVVRLLHTAGHPGDVVEAIALRARETEEKTRALLVFLHKIRVVQHFKTPAQTGVRTQLRWRLEPRLAEMWKGVLEDAKA